MPNGSWGNGQPLFLNSTRKELRQYRNAANVFQTDFYTWQRKYRSILTSKRTANLRRQSGHSMQTTASDTRPNQNHPNSRIRLPSPFDLQKPPPTSNPIFPTTRKYRFITLPPAEACTGWMIFTSRFRDFGPYEDAIVNKEAFLHHSVLSPLINIGLLGPQEVIEQSPVSSP